MQLPALILAGGLGTRLRGVLADRPKVLAPVAGRPFLSYLLDQVQAAGVRDVILCCGYLADQIEAMFGARHGALSLTYSRETEPLGTGGALRLALPGVQAEAMLVLNGDSYVDCPLADFVTWHRQHAFAGSLLLTRVPDAARFGTVAVREQGAVLSFKEKRGVPDPGWINAGVYLLARRLVERLPEGRAISLEHEAFGQWLSEGMGGYQLQAAFLDIGTPESLAQADEFFGRLAGMRKEFA
jgi:D-glycero-alpha-D-manno-heptose 1-phosphate guanylyltransferase